MSVFIMKKAFTAAYKDTVIKYPTLNSVLTYNHAEQSPTWTNYDSLAITIGGVTSATNLGSYVTTFTPNKGYCWEDGGIYTYSIEWSIMPVTVSYPSYSESFMYNGNAQSPAWVDYNETAMDMSGDTEGINAGVYTTTFTLNYGYCWSDGSTEAYSIEWEISRLTIAYPSVSKSLTYNGSTQSPTWIGYDTTKMVLDGTTDATDVGIYTATFTPTSNYCWADSSVEVYNVEWSIIPMTVSKPAYTGTLTYNGSVQSPDWTEYNETAMTISGDTEATNAGTYTTIFTLNSENYCWEDSTVSAYEATWVIEKVKLAYPTVSGTLTYNNATQSPTWVNYNSEQLTIGGTTSAKTIGSYTATFTPKSNYCWDDGSVSAYSVTWSIVGLTVPSQSKTLTYTGSSQSVTWKNYDSTKMTVSGTTTGTNAGSYTAKFTLKSGNMWSDGTTAAKSVTWTIGKASCNLTASITSATLNINTTSTTCTVSRSGTGTISVKSSDTSAVTVSLSGSTVTMKRVSNAGATSVTITISVAETTNYKSGSRTISVNTTLIGVERPANIYFSAVPKGETRTVTTTQLVDSGYDSSKMTYSVSSLTVKSTGEYPITYTLKSGYQWSSGTSTTKTQPHTAYICISDGIYA